MANKKPGYPRFKGKIQYDSFTYPQSGYKIEGDRLILSCMGSIKIKLHRELEGKVKTCTVIRKNGKYYACFSSEHRDVNAAKNILARVTAKHKRMAWNKPSGMGEVTNPEEPRSPHL